MMLFTWLLELKLKITLEKSNLIKIYILVKNIKYLSLIMKNALSGLSSDMVPFSYTTYLISPSITCVLSHRLLSHLSKQSGMRSPDASMDEVLCALFMAALYSLDLSLLTTELDESELFHLLSLYLLFLN